MDLCIPFPFPFPFPFNPKPSPNPLEVGLGVGGKTPYPAGVVGTDSVAGSCWDEERDNDEGVYGDLGVKPGVPNPYVGDLVCKVDAWNDGDLACEGEDGPNAGGGPKAGVPGRLPLPFMNGDASGLAYGEPPYGESFSTTHPLPCCTTREVGLGLPRERSSLPPHFFLAPDACADSAITSSPPVTASTALVPIRTA